MTGRAVVIGVSAGGLQALGGILPGLPAGLDAAVIVVQHVSEKNGGRLHKLLNTGCRMQVREAEEKKTIRPGVVYIAPPGYHLLVERDRTFSLSVDEPVNYSRPSIDVLFESAAEAYGRDLIGVILTGANCDGSAGLKRIKELGGRAVVQNPDSAEAREMPESALRTTEVDHVVEIPEIGPLLTDMCETQTRSRFETVETNHDG